MRNDIYDGARGCLGSDCLRRFPACCAYDDQLIIMKTYVILQLRFDSILLTLDGMTMDMLPLVVARNLAHNHYHVYFDLDGHDLPAEYQTPPAPCRARPERFLVRSAYRDRRCSSPHRGLISPPRNTQPERPPFPGLYAYALPD